MNGEEQPAKSFGSGITNPEFCFYTVFVVLHIGFRFWMLLEVYIDDNIFFGDMML